MFNLGYIFSVDDDPMIRMIMKNLMKQVLDTISLRVGVGKIIIKENETFSSFDKMFEQLELYGFQIDQERSDLIFILDNTMLDNTEQTQIRTGSEAANRLRAKFPKCLLISYSSDILTAPPYPENTHFFVKSVSRHAEERPNLIALKKFVRKYLESRLTDAGIIINRRLDASIPLLPSQVNPQPTTQTETSSARSVLNLPCHEESRSPSTQFFGLARLNSFSLRTDSSSTTDILLSEFSATPITPIPATPTSSGTTSSGTTTLDTTLLLTETSFITNTPSTVEENPFANSSSDCIAYYQK